MVGIIWRNKISKRSCIAAWLPYWVAKNCGGTELAAAAQECWTSKLDIRERLAVMRKMEAMIVAAIREKHGDQPWLDEWWKFLQN